MSLRRSLVIVSLFCAFAGTASAQTLSIRPALVDSSEPVEAALAANKGRATTVIEGQGGTLQLTYQADQAVEVFMVPVDSAGSYAITDFLRFTLPQTDQGDVAIDLTVSPGWSPAKKKWLVNLLTKDEGASAGFLKMDFVPTSTLGSVGAAIGHLMTTEPYTPSTYHALRGYRIYGVSVAVILGILTLIACALALIFSKEQYRFHAVLGVVLISLGLYQLRFSVDLLRFTNQHLSEYSNGLYDEAGSVYQIAPVLQTLQTLNPQASVRVYVCRDGTNYKEKVLRYLAYPIPVFSDEARAMTANTALVMNKYDWSLQTVTVGGKTITTLKCGAINRPAERIKEFDDGSILFKFVDA